MRDIPWGPLKNTINIKVVQWDKYAITDDRPRRDQHPTLIDNFTLWTHEGPRRSDPELQPWKIIAYADSLLTVYAWLIEYKHPDFTRGGSDG